MSVRRAGEGPDLVWIHGLGESSTCFDACVAAMPGWTHVLPDLPCYGRSPWAEPCSLRDLAAQLAPFVAGRFVIGHSMGGVLATLIAEHTAVRGIVNVEGNLSSGDCVFSGRAAVYSLGDFVAHGFDAVRAWVFEQAVASPAMRAYHGALVFASPQAFHQHARDLVALSSTKELARRLAALRVPTLYIAGIPDGICERSRELLDAHHVRWIGVEPAGHWVYADQLERFVTVVSAFLRGA
jgi:pimeloyl-ACP methyl ester carboxylesterase